MEPNFDVGDLVVFEYFIYSNIKKLVTTFNGPYKIISKLLDINYEIDHPNYHTDNTIQFWGPSKFLTDQPQPLHNRKHQCRKLYMVEKDIHIGLQQNAHCNKADTPSSFPKNWRTFKCKNNSAHLVVRSTALVITHLLMVKNWTYISITTKKDEIIVGSTHAAPYVDFGESLVELHRGKLSFGVRTSTPTPHCGVTVVSPILWCYTEEDLKGDFLTEHFIVINLAIVNLTNSDATFEKINN